MAIAQKDIKLLWGRSAGQCSICREKVSEDKVRFHLRICYILLKSSNRCCSICCSKRRSITQITYRRSRRQWQIDLLMDPGTSGHPIRILSILDTNSRQSPTIQVKTLAELDHSALNQLPAGCTGGCVQLVMRDNGSSMDTAGMLVCNFLTANVYQMVTAAARAGSCERSRGHRCDGPSDQHCQ